MPILASLVIIINGNFDEPLDHCRQTYRGRNPDVLVLVLVFSRRSFDAAQQSMDSDHPDPEMKCDKGFKWKFHG
jgi:hypothetical protein